MEKVPKSAPRIIFDRFWNFWGILAKLDLLLLMTDPSVQFGSNELCLLWKGDQYCREKFLYLKGSSIGWKKFERVLPEAFLTSFQFFEKFYCRPKFYFLWPTFQYELVQMNYASCERFPMS